MDSMLDQFNNATPEVAVDVQEFDKLIVKLREMRDTKDIWKKALSELQANLDEVEGKILNLLKLTKKNNWEVPGIGMAYKSTKLEVRMSDDLNRRRELRDFVLGKYGQDVTDTMFSVNYQALNKFYKDELAQVPEKEQADFVLPGLDKPQSSEIIGFRRK